ncbi:hypothetical protein MKW98_026367 [Papaver atlanticum]|uniref:J domain-containing protein n=1 Tax=Papaver atlanticum TaxID=357466 RepID=A0AAD4XJQ4_9MAGN|nr:hypothetical protein MKW98_026367 [Papaver atlanticum]
MRATPTAGGNVAVENGCSALCKTTKVQDISGSFRWAPFLALQKSDTFLTMLLHLSKYLVRTVVGIKKAYRKATLRVHPDKLQQQGATIQQKYICGKVFSV